jgi:integrase
MCADMVSAKKREFRVRDENPVREVKPPERGSRKAKQFLWPSEFLQFVSSDCVPLAMRRAVAQAIYLFPRDGEHRALEWGAGDVDLEHGVLSITRALNARTGTVESTKSGETRRFAIETNPLPLLHAMHDEAKGKGAVIGWHEPHMSRALRRALQRAGVTRPELHEGSPTRKPLTWHDLRATGLTWMAIRGDDPLKIRQRAGHAAFSTTEIYIRDAEAVDDAFGEVFPPLPA